jgi:hypothetical protein
MPSVRLVPLSPVSPGAFRRAQLRTQVFRRGRSIRMATMQFLLQPVLNQGGPRSAQLRMPLSRQDRSIQMDHPSDRALAPGQLPYNHIGCQWLAQTMHHGYTSMTKLLNITRV